MSCGNKRICPVALAGHLDSRLRRWLHDPLKILTPYIRHGMSVLDIGCGPGFFTLDMARLVGPSGRVMAVDIQADMLQIVRRKIQGTELEARITPHLIDDGRIGVLGPFDFVLAFYMVHEVPDQQMLFNEIHAALKPAGLALIVEPPLHVSRKAFEATICAAQGAGLVPVARPKISLSKAVLLQKD